MTSNTLASFGQQIRARREDVGLSQIELAALAGVHRGTVRNVEQDKPMEVRTSANMLRTLGCAPVLHVLRPLLSTATTRAITRGLCDLVDAEADSRWAIDCYLEVVDAAARAGAGNHESLPAGFPRLRDHLPLTVQQRRALDAELAQLFNEPPPDPAPPPVDNSPSTAAGLTAIAEAIDRLTAAVIHANTDRRRT